MWYHLKEYCSSVWTDGSVFVRMETRESGKLFLMQLRNPLGLERQVLLSREYFDISLCPLVLPEFGVNSFQAFL